ncbi:tricorn protease [Parapedobacter defluvii]|uniref:Tricorn protease homolog n=1 Tax=Parapedobacter defluvii TaxID=2045106 RepID=A0ABQ1LY76_9SPHI|nr:S41 family peptidase [Parapedobacter defluvii]GGC30513.1 tricorn protease [Parapedobacter defluvii]
MKKIMLILLTMCAIWGANAQDEARLLRFPTVHGDQVAFTYAGDLYIVPASGGVARRITSHLGHELFPRFSHDGKYIAFTGQYDGNTEVFIIPATGGIPKRITYTPTLSRDDLADRMGPNNIVMGWTPDDQHVIYRGRGTSFNPFKGKLYLAPLNGDLSLELPFSVASWASYNADGSKLAMNRVFREFRTWKYYRGGMADDIWLVDPKSGDTENVTNHPAQDVFPMYYQDKIYFVSDRDRTANLFVYDTQSKQTQKVTNFTEYDVKFPSLGDHAIVFENGGYIYHHDLISGQTQKLRIIIAEDFASGRNRQVDASTFVYSADISPDGKRAVFGARGDVFTVPAKTGVTRNLTQSSGAHDRNVGWSPDGQWISYISDRTGEDELYIQKQDGTEPALQLTKGGGAYKFNPVWSPDSKKLLYGDRNQDLYVVEIPSGAKQLVTHCDDGTITSYTFGPDSKWIAYSLPGKAREFTVINLYHLDTKRIIQVTDTWYNSSQPEFSPDGKLLYFVSERDFNPTYGSTEWNHVYNNMSRPYLVRLNTATKSPFAEESDEVTTSSVYPEEERTQKDDSKKETQNEITITVDEEGLADRIESLPVSPGSYFGLVATTDGLYYTGGSQGNRSFKFFSLADKKETEIGNFSGYATSPDRKKILIRSDGDFFIEDLGKSKISAPSNKVNMVGMKVTVDLKAEWKQIYDESWRQMRDYFYDPDMHGVDWKAMHDKYAPLLPYVNHRDDLTYLIGELIGELNVGHAYVNSGDRPSPERIPMGLLGAIFSRDPSGYYRIDSILSGQSWNTTLASPLRAPGVAAKRGEYITAINGTSMKDVENLYQTLIGKAGQLVEIEINGSPTAKGARKVLVKPIADESALYYHEWVQQNIAKVTAASNGRIGYIHIPDMGPDGLNQFARYFYPQLDKEALIIDDRGNGGGNVSPMIIERLIRKPGLGTMRRNNKTASIKPDAHVGPKVCLIDQYSASDGDLFPWQFRYYGIGPLIGQRTWGGVVGISGTLPFIDGGDMRKPEFAHFAADGSSFIIEGEGVHPDIEVTNDPYDEYQQNDAQLARGVAVLLEKLADGSAIGVPKIPAFPDKSK